MTSELVVHSSGTILLRNRPTSWELITELIAVVSLKHQGPRFQIGKAYALNAIAQKLSSLADSLTLQNIYIVTVDWCQVCLII